MKRFLRHILTALLFPFFVQAQVSFPFDIELVPVTVPGLPGLHSYAYGQHNGKWVVIGGRIDGIHARQPFNAFPASQNNSNIFVIDINTQQLWSANLSTLSVAESEHLQSTNMNFHQEGDTLYFIGGYSFSISSNDHITHPFLTTINLPGIIDAVLNNTSLQPHVKQLSDAVFGVCGGHLAYLDGMFYLVGGHNFNGQYNPMGGPTYTQTYTNQIRKFTIDNSGTQLSYSNYTTITDPVHLHRRDYNLLPQIFPNGEAGFTISSGVFQVNVDLPYLYPVDITASGYTPVTGFNQYLSNYHSATACLFDSTQNEMHALFFGGMSQYYYQNNVLVQDNEVPFVKTISRLTRDASGNLQEYVLPVEMPSLQGSSAEFIYNENLPHYPTGIIDLSAIPQDTIEIGHILGGIYSPSINPFSNNLTNQTSADTTVYLVRLIRNQTSSVPEVINGKNPYRITLFPNPTDGHFEAKFNLTKDTKVEYYITNASGIIVRNVSLGYQEKGDQQTTIDVSEFPNQSLIVNFVFDDLYYATGKVSVK